MNDKSMVEFYHKSDQLFSKVNGQIMEAMDYKGNNRFEGGLGQMAAQFDIQKEGGVKTTVSYLGAENNMVSIEGVKSFKY